MNLSGSLVEQITNLDTGASVVRRSVGSGEGLRGTTPATGRLCKYGGASVLPFFDGEP